MRGKESVKKRKGGFNIQSIIMSVLMASTLITITIMGLLLYYRFKLAMDNTAVSNTEATVESSVDRLNSDLLDIRQIFNAANYNICLLYTSYWRNRTKRIENPDAAGRSENARAISCYSCRR